MLPENPNMFLRYDKDLCDNDFQLDKRGWCKFVDYYALLVFSVRLYESQQALSSE